MGGGEYDPTGRLLGLYVEITADEMLLGVGGGGGGGGGEEERKREKAEAVLAIAIVVDAVSTAILAASGEEREKEKEKEKGDGRFTFKAKWSYEQRKVLYKWLRSSHTWPSEEYEETCQKVAMEEAETMATLQAEESQSQSQSQHTPSHAARSRKKSAWASAMPLVRSRVPLSRSLEKAVFKFAARALGKMVRMGPVLSETAVERLGREVEGGEGKGHV